MTENKRILKVHVINEDLLLVQKKIKMKNLEIPRISGRAPEDLDVPDSESGIKRTFCFYCKKLVCRLPRHLEAKHREEEEVKQLMILPKGCPEKKEMLSIIRKKGNFLFNTKREYNNGKLIVTRRPQKSKHRDANHYIICPKCLGHFSQLTATRHFMKCHTYAKKGDKKLRTLSRKVTGYAHKRASDTLRFEIIPVMRNDEITLLIKHDELAVIYGNKMCQKYRSHHHHPMIRSKLRLIGRLLTVLKDLDSAIKKFSDVFRPRYYDDAIKAINQIAHLDPETKMYGAPSTAFNAGILLKQCAKILISEYIKKEKYVKKQRVEDFLKLITEDFASSVNKTVTETQDELKRQKKIILPSIRDIKCLHKYLTENRRKYFLKIKELFNVDDWKQLASFTLISIQLFNRRRAGELERIKISDFNNYESIQEDDEIFKFLSQEAIQAARAYIRITIRGKLGRTVPVLLDSELFECVQIILKHRREAGVSDNNPYIFGIKGKDNDDKKFLRACALMRKYSEECNAEKPSTLRGTELRKHIATHSIMLNLQENEISDLANYMGHSQKIHKDIYRVPVPTRDITKMSQLLRKAQGESSDEDEIAEGVNFPNNKSVDGDIQPAFNITENTACEDFREETDSLNIGSEIVIESLDFQNNSASADMTQKMETATTVTNDIPEERETSPALENIRNKYLSADMTQKMETATTVTNDIPEERETSPALENIRNKYLSADMTQKIETATTVTNDISEETQASPAFEDIRKIRKVLFPNTDNSSEEDPYATDSDPEFCIETERKKRKKVRFLSEHDSDTDSDDGRFRKRKVSRNGKKMSRAAWTTPEKSITKEIFTQNFISGKLPTMKECQQAIDGNIELQSRTATQLKAYIHNQTRKISASRSGVRFRTWSTPEKESTKGYFKENLKSKKLPSLKECEEARKVLGLTTRNAASIKTWIKEEIKRQEKKKIN